MTLEVLYMRMLWIAAIAALFPAGAAADNAATAAHMNTIMEDAKAADVEEAFREDLEKLDSEIGELENSLDDQEKRVEGLRERREALAEKAADASDDSPERRSEFKREFDEEVSEIRDEYGDLKRRLSN